MKNQIITFELQKLLKDKVNYLLMILVFSFTLLAIFTGSKWASFQLETINKIEKDQNIKLNQQIDDAVIYEKTNEILKSNYPLSFTCYLNCTMNYYVTEPHPNAIFSIGQSDLYPNYIRYKRLGAYTLHKNNEIQNPLNLLIGKLDFYFLLVYLIPLFIIVITFDLISSEKELGTLKMIKVYYPNIQKFFLYKFIFRYVWFTLFFITSIFIGIKLFSPFNLDTYLISEIFISIVAIALYILFWFSVVYLINSLFRSSTFNGISLTIIWLIIVYVVPTLIQSFIDRKHQTPSRINGIVESLELATDKNKSPTKIYTEFINKKKEYIQIKRDTIIDRLKIKSYYQTMIVNSIYFDSISISKQEKLNKPLDKQYDLLTTFKIFSPTLIIQNNLNLLSRNGYPNFRNFQNNFLQNYKKLQKASTNRLFRGKRILKSEFRKEGNLHKYQRSENVIKELLINTGLLIIFCFIINFIAFQLFKKNSINFE